MSDPITNDEIAAARERLQADIMDSAGMDVTVVNTEDITLLLSALDARADATTEKPRISASDVHGVPTEVSELREDIARYLWMNGNDRILSSRAEVESIRLHASRAMDELCRRADAVLVVPDTTTEPSDAR